MKRLLLIFIMAVLAVPSDAATVYMKDGGALHGTVVSATAQNIELNTGNGTVTIPAEKIQSINYSDQGSPSAPAQPAPSAPAPQLPPPARVRVRRMPPRRWVYQDGNEKNEFSLNLGFNTPLSDINFSSIGGGSDSNGSPGILLGARYINYVSPRLGLGLDFNYMDRGGTDSQNLVPNSDTNVFGDSLVFMGVLKYLFIPDGPTRPYLLLGLGTHRTSTVIDATPNLGFSWSDTNTGETRRLVDDSAWGFASTAKVGIDFHYRDPYLFGLELGWTGLMGGTYHVTPAGQALGLVAISGPLNVFTFGGRVGWRF